MRQDLHIRGLNLLDFSCREERFMTTAPACNQHSNPFVLPAFKCRTLKHPLYIAKPFVSELTPAMAEKELLTTIYKANCNPTSFSGGVPGIKVNQFPRIQPCRGYTIYTSTLYRDSHFRLLRSTGWSPHRLYTETFSNCLFGE
ncbi:hypothetical protein GDO81_011353 [Engystomops pustulosus]|uniref:Uncharacterized protein n=1 Tax=Engystomops pustulosus TaxID=76066 RepID=A0AAV7BDQ2_ENGPU|nr:hypothetical protein GDO81_011353 [Engystomops pustulosus]KAG8570622.1 hypothetical protein GDO81_011353 [Engystomops pustulosus]